jgi:hypothetical protein
MEPRPRSVATHTARIFSCSFALGNSKPAIVDYFLVLAFDFLVLRQYCSLIILHVFQHRPGSNISVSAVSLLFGRHRDEKSRGAFKVLISRTIKQLWKFPSGRKRRRQCRKKFSFCSLLCASVFGQSSSLPSGLTDVETAAA